MQRAKPALLAYELIHADQLLFLYLGCGINNRTSSIIERPISTVTLSFRSIRGTLIGQRYLRGRTELDPDRSFH